MAVLWDGSGKAKKQIEELATEANKVSGTENFSTSIRDKAAILSEKGFLEGVGNTCGDYFCHPGQYAVLDLSSKTYRFSSHNAECFEKAYSEL